MLIDLSHTIASGMMQVASLPPVEVCRVSALAEGKPTNGQALRISGHSGTHIDAPLHVFDELASIETFPADRFIGPGVALSVPKGPRDPVSAADLDAAGRRVYGVCVLTSTLEDVYLDAVGEETS